ncbi:MAG TPA: RecQ family ATP-dependent DNA helicase, partial [Clostridia bacterium]|nr:RecQ family ATP-dependent DNA helicase [Clostridia bacterium]
MSSIVFIDSEISTENGRILDLGAVKANHTQFHSASTRGFVEFVSKCDFICGHNIIAHDLEYISNIFGEEPIPFPIDTLPLSPLLFPRKPYHALLKDDKLQTDELNNPLNDSIKAMELFYDEINAFEALQTEIKQIYCALLFPLREFQGFLKYAGYKPYPISEPMLKSVFEGKLCANVNISTLIRSYPVELAYTLALIYTDDHHSITPPWVLKNYPKTENMIKFIRNTPCAEGCLYCNNKLNVNIELKRIFGYDSFRTYNGEPLQEKAAQAAVQGKSLLAVFPTGGGKSITFQLPALMAGEAVHGLTVVISPLQSLMKDQVDNLEEQGIVDAVTVNGMLSPIERSESLARVENGMATMLYIAPEQLRSKTIERLLLSRNVVRFVIDEAHCFSAWGQDFRVDYLYIGDFIRKLQKKKGLKTGIPVSCFTATAKQKVISDIRDYFKKKLNLEIQLYTTTATRENLRYAVLYKETEDEKYNTLRTLIEQKDCPTIVYVSRTRRTFKLAEKLTSDGFPAKPFNGKMDSTDKITNQEAFIRNEIKVIVATSAFGMGVDKKDVGLLVHYDISDSLENYVQESGRAGRDQSLQAECFVLFNDEDLDK